MTFVSRLLKKKPATNASPQIGTKLYNYIVVNPTHYKNIQEAANIFAEMGWRVSAVVSDTRSGYAHAIIFERPVGVTHPDDLHI